MVFKFRLRMTRNRSMYRSRNNLSARTPSQPRGERPFQPVTHQRPIVNFGERMDMTQALKRAGHHLVAKQIGRVKVGDFGSQPLPDTQMGRFKRQRVPRLRQSGRFRARLTLPRVRDCLCVNS